jgi:hypothetical protein
MLIGVEEEGSFKTPLLRLNFPLLRKEMEIQCYSETCFAAGTQGGYLKH